MSGRPRRRRQEFVVAAKGAPEAIAGLCRFGAADLAALTQSVDAMAADGLRVLGVARASFAGQPWPASQHDFTFEFLGLVGLADPLRRVSRCGQRMPVGRHQGGHDYRRLSGDRRGDRPSGRHRRAKLVTGEELEPLSEAELASRVQTATVFARIMPEQKLRIVNALKAMARSWR